MLIKFPNLCATLIRCAWAINIRAQGNSSSITDLKIKHLAVPGKRQSDPWPTLDTGWNSSNPKGFSQTNSPVLTQFTQVLYRFAHSSWLLQITCALAPLGLDFVTKPSLHLECLITQKKGCLWPRSGSYQCQLESQMRLNLGLRSVRSRGVLYPPLGGCRWYKVLEKDLYKV